jgi:hypothetical protein
MKAARSFETSGISNSATQRNKPEGLNPPADSNLSNEDIPCL